MPPTAHPLIELFLSPGRPLALYLNLLIAGLAFLSLGMAVRVILQKIPQEWVILRRLKGMESPTREGALAAVGGSETVVAERIRDLNALASARHPIDAGALSGLNAAAFRGDLSSASSLGRSLIVLGLFGTLLGLGTAVTSLASTLSSSGMNAQALAAAILQTLGGMQTAFGTTLTGIVGSLLVGFSVSVARNRQSRLLQEIERVTTVTLVPLFDTSEASRLTDAVAALDRIEVRLGEDLLRIVSGIETEGKALGSKLEEEFNKIEEAFARRAEELVRATGAALESTLNIIGEREEGEPTLAQYVRSVRQTVDGLQEAVASVGDLLPSVEQRLTETLELQRQTLESALVEHRQEMAPLMARQSEAAELLSVSIQQGAARSDELAQILSQLASGLEAAQESWTRTDTVIAEVGRSCNEGIQNGLREFVARLEAGQRDTTAEREAISRNLATFQQELTRHSEKMLTERTVVLRQMTDLLTEIQSAVSAAVLQVGSELGTRESATGQALTMAVENLARELRAGLVQGPRTPVSVGSGRDGTTLPGTWPSHPPAPTPPAPNDRAESE